MVKVSVVVLLLITATAAGRKQQKPSPKIQCRVMAVDINTKYSHTGDWIDCKLAEDTEEYIFETLDHPGLVLWVDEEVKTGKIWSKPSMHSEPKLILEDNFGKDRMNS